MTDPVIKARKHVAVWHDTAELLKTLSEETGYSQIELLYEAIVDLAAKLRQATPAPAKETHHA